MTRNIIAIEKLGNNIQEERQNMNIGIVSYYFFTISKLRIRCPLDLSSDTGPTIFFCFTDFRDITLLNGHANNFGILDRNSNRC